MMAALGVSHCVDFVPMAEPMFKPKEGIGQVQEGPCRVTQLPRGSSLGSELRSHLGNNATILGMGSWVSPFWDLKSMVCLGLVNFLCLQRQGKQVPDEEVCFMWSGHSSPSSWFPWGTRSRIPGSAQFFFQMVQFCLHIKTKRKAIMQKNPPRWVWFTSFLDEVIILRNEFNSGGSGCSHAGLWFYNSINCLIKHLE